jgi:hypothetical protein
MNVLAKLNDLVSESPLRQNPSRLINFDNEAELGEKLCSLLSRLPNRAVVGEPVKVHVGTLKRGVFLATVEIREIGSSMSIPRSDAGMRLHTALERALHKPRAAARRPFFHASRQKV